MENHEHDWKIRWTANKEGYSIYCDCGAEYDPEDLIFDLVELEALRKEFVNVSRKYGELLASVYPGPIV